MNRRSTMSEQPLIDLAIISIEELPSSTSLDEAVVTFSRWRSYTRAYQGTGPG